MMHLYILFAIVVFIRAVPVVTFSSQDLESGDKTCYDNSPHSNGVAPEYSLEKKENGEYGLSMTETGNQTQSTEAFVKSGQEQEHDYNHEDGLDGDNDTCSLYMAESSIFNAGLGVYTARSLSKGEVLNFSEVLLTHVDLFTNMRMSQLFTETEARQYYEIINSTETDIRKDCVVLALNGMCEHDANIRTTECAQTCALHSSGFDVKKRLIFLQDQDDPRLCKHWAELDECTHNPNFMLQECAQSCTIFEYGLYEDIKQSRAQWLPSHYYWVDEGVGTHFEANDATTFLPGLGSLPNSHMGLVNLDLRGHTYDNAGYHRLKDVGVGAFSSRHNITFEVLQDVPAGMELFLNYGEQYFSSKTRLLRHVPSSGDYLEADNILSEFVRKVQELQEGNENNDSTAASMYERLLESIDNPRLRNALPPNYQIIQQGKNKNAAMLSVPNVIRSSEWLKEYGMCIDRLYPGPSTVSQAGRGAFASRSIQNGQVIAHMPLLHMDREKLRRFVGAKEITPQLSINYSYGHKSSSMVLLPYSPAVNFVNHNFDKSKVNAKLQWSSRSYHQQQWENDAVSEILQRQQSGLMMELVATQDIPQGHEVFLDYGGRWEEAWMAHVSNWTPPSDSYSIAYDNVEDLNHPENLEIRILEEQRDLPYGENVVIMCWLDVIKLFSNVRSGLDGDFQWEQFRVERSGTAQAATDNVTKKCEIVQRLNAPNDAEIDDMDDGDLKRTTLYTASVKFGATGSKEFFIKGIPRSEIFFENKKYASDQFLENAFRHVIDIPDEIFPAAWKDLEHGV